MLPRFIIYSVVSVAIAVLPFAAKAEYKMPMLKWAGKDKVVNHHNDVPFRVLERKWAFGDGACTNGENMVVHGDNLAALKALLPQYEGRVKCIFCLRVTAHGDRRFRRRGERARVTAVVRHDYERRPRHAQNGGQ